jgi:hypothetical protein
VWRGGAVIYCNAYCRVTVQKSSVHKSLTGTGHYYLARKWGD